MKGNNDITKIMKYSLYGSLLGTVNGTTAYVAWFALILYFGLPWYFYVLIAVTTVAFMSTKVLSGLVSKEWYSLEQARKEADGWLDLEIGGTYNLNDCPGYMVKILSIEKSVVDYIRISGTGSQFYVDQRHFKRNAKSFKAEFENTLTRWKEEANPQSMPETWDHRNIHIGPAGFPLCGIKQPSAMCFKPELFFDLGNEEFRGRCQDCSNIYDRAKEEAKAHWQD